jgi:hypothetical protein
VSQKKTPRGAEALSDDQVLQLTALRLSGQLAQAGLEALEPFVTDRPDGFEDAARKGKAQRRKRG